MSFNKMWRNSCQDLNIILTNCICKSNNELLWNSLYYWVKSLDLSDSIEISPTKNINLQDRDSKTNRGQKCVKFRGLSRWLARM